MASPSPKREVLFRANPGRQQRFVDSGVRELLWGGEAGGGKSAALVAAPLRWVERPLFRALLLRRRAVDLGPLLEKAHRLYPRVGGTWRASESCFAWASGARIRFGHVEHETDKYKYQGDEFQLIGFDELTHFTEGQYLEVSSRLRTVDPAQPCLLRATSNPGGPGHGWVLARWAQWLDPKHEHAAREGEVRWFTEGREVPKGAPLAQGRAFLRSVRAECKQLDPGYEGAIAQLDAVRRAQLGKGDWLAKAAAGLLFKRTWIRTWLDAPLRVATHRVRYWDLAAGGDWAVGGRLARGVDGLDVVEHVARIKGTPAQVRALVIATAQQDGPSVPLFLEQDPGQAGKDQGWTYQREPELRGFAVRPRPKRTNKVTAFGPFSARQETGAIAWVRGAWNEPVLEVLEGFPDGDTDDDADALSGAFAALPFCRVSERRGGVQQPSTTRAHEDDAWSDDE